MTLRELIAANDRERARTIIARVKSEQSRRK